MIQIIHHGDVRELRLNRPPVNALSGELISFLKEAIQAAPREGCRALVLSGLPGRFSGGLDIPLLLGLDKLQMANIWHDFYSLLGSIAESDIPIVAAMTGHAPAGGTVLGLFCDWRVMAEGDYVLGLNEVQVGIPLPPIIVVGLRRLVGPRIAERLAVTGALFSPAQAKELGLVDELVPAEQTVERAVDYCRRLLGLPQGAMLSTRREARSDLIALFAGPMEPELQRVIESWWSPETQETLSALRERLSKKRSER